MWNCDFVIPFDESDKAKLAADGSNAYVLGVVSTLHSIFPLKLTISSSLIPSVRILVNSPALWR